VKEEIMSIRASTIAALAAALSLSFAAACDLDVPDLDNPPLDGFLNNPTRVDMQSACTGLQVANRRNYAQPNGYIAQLGILGREAYNFDKADPRFFGELLEGPLQQGSPFGGNFWGQPYASIRLANIIQGAVDRVPDYSPAEKAGVLGFSKTIEATDLLEVAVTHDTNGGVINTDRDLAAGLAPIVGKNEMLAEIARLLDEAAGDLGRAGDEFPFTLTRGYDGFDSPPSFLRFNRAIKARVAVYQGQYDVADQALMGSFINGTPASIRDLETGVYHTYSIGAGDVFNGLNNTNIYAHPSIKTDAMMNGSNIDQRFTRKVKQVLPEDAGSGSGLSSNLKFTMYNSAGAPAPIIRNEELLLLRAETRYKRADVTGAMADLNLVRTLSGSLVALPAPATEAEFVTALLYERRYSLLFEGHRLIDVRRLGHVMDLPLDMPNVEDPPQHVRNIRYPIPRAECDARPGEAACMLGSM
jgi:hypothetical protein